MYKKNESLIEHSAKKRVEKVKKKEKKKKTFILVEVNFITA